MNGSDTAPPDPNYWKKMDELCGRVDAHTEAIASAMTSLATGPGKDGYAYAVLAAAVGVPPEQTPREKQ